jgi:hypothetical protein
MADLSPSDKIQIKLEALRHTQNFLAKQEALTVDSLLVEAKKIEEYLLTAAQPVIPASSLPRKN